MVLRVFGVCVVLVLSIACATPAPVPEPVPVQPLPDPEPEPEPEPEKITTESGLVYQVFEAGEGATPSPGQSVRVHYTGWFEDGTEFTTSKGDEPLSFPLGRRRVIAGWEEAIGLMKVGARWRLTIPAALAYGDKGIAEVIPPGATLIYEVELVGVSE